VTIRNVFRCFKLSVDYSKLLVMYGCNYKYCLRLCIENRFASEAVYVTSNSLSVCLFFFLFNCFIVVCKRVFIGAVFPNIYSISWLVWRMKMYVAILWSAACCAITRACNG